MQVSPHFQCICSETEHSSLFTAGPYTICQCAACGQVYSLGLDLGTVKEQYTESNYFSERNAYAARWAEFSRSFQKIFDKIIPFKPQGRLLDVGCSVGILLDVAQKNGFAATGVEVSTWASEFARQKGFDVLTGGLLDASYPDKGFDVVILNHVLEHMPNPAEVLHEVRRILKDDGLLVIGVPNFGSTMASLMKERWASLLPEQHIWHYTHASLLRLLAASGFSEIFFEARENHRVNWLSPRSILYSPVNIIALLRNNAESMILFGRKLL